MHGLGQERQMWSYGIRLNASTPTIPGDQKDFLGPWIGGGATMFGSYHYKPHLSFSSGLSYHAHAYSITKPYQLAQAQYLQVPLDVRYQPKSWGGSQILGGVNLGIPLSAYKVVTDPSVGDSSISFSSKTVQPDWALGLFAGIGFDIGDHFNLAFTYHRQIRSVYKQTHHEGRPHYVQATLSFDFSKVIRNWSSPVEFSQVRSLKEKGVIVVLPTDLFEDSISREVGLRNITTAFDSVYSFSNFRFEQDSFTTEGAPYYIFFGKLFAKGTETAKNGMYTFNSDLEALQENYFYSIYNQFTNDDFQNYRGVLKMVINYQNQLEEAYQEYLNRSKEE
jgi:hypothetical protein